MEESVNPKKTPSQIQPGDKFGHWTVIRYDHKNQHNVKYFLCQCDCGTIRPVKGTALVYGKSTACSRTCYKIPKIGEEFGNWTVIAVDKSRASYVWCRCKCGTERSVSWQTLKNGTSKSCGCLSRQHSRENKSYIGQKFGKLTIESVELKPDQHYYAHCLCECGSRPVIKLTAVTKGYTYSCGCINSKANEKMAGILNKYNIPFKREYKFEDCRNIHALPFDFALFNECDELIGLIENNGEQHYSSRGMGWFTADRVAEIQQRDYIKQKYCEDNHIPLLIVPYQYFDELEKFLITSDFWKVIIKNFNDQVPANWQDCEGRESEDIV